METKLYIPPGAVSLDAPNARIQLRLGIQGLSGKGKTFGCTTFRNPIFLSYNRGLIAHMGKPNIHEIKFYDNAYIDTLAKRVAPTYVDVETEEIKPRPFNRKDALIAFLSGDAQKITGEQTLIFDASTDIEAAFHIQYGINPHLADSGKIDASKEWKFKLDYFTEIAMLIKSLTCDVIYITHEAQATDDKGNFTSKINPLMSGKFKAQLISHFTDWFRAEVTTKPTKDKYNDFKAKYFLTDADAKEWIESTPSNSQVIYIWDTQADETAEAKTSLVGAPKYILQHSKSLEKYKRKYETV